NNDRRNYQNNYQNGYQNNDRRNYQNNYQNGYQNNDRRNYQYDDRRNPNNYGRNVYYNRNYQRRYNDNRNYPLQRRYNDYPRNIARSRNNGNRQQQGRRRSQSRQPRQQSRRRPRQIILDDFMPEQLRDRSSSASNPPVESNNNNAPPEALPQREIFRIRTAVAENNTNTTQPFRVTEEEEKQDNVRQQRRTTTASYRRRQRRMNRQQYRQNDDNKNVPRNRNRFNALSQAKQDQEEDEEEDEYEQGINNNNNKDDYESLSKKKNIDKKKKKTHLYLDTNRIIKWFEDNSKNSKNVIQSRGNQAYIAATASTYDSWIRDNYELQVWQAYLKVYKEQKHWAKEVIQRTKHRDDSINTRFVQKKINRLYDNITEATATITDVQIQLSAYWTQNTTEATAQKQAQMTAELAANLIIERTGLATTTSTIAPSGASTITIRPSSSARDSVDRLEKLILEYLYQCTKHVKTMTDNRIQLCKAQSEEFKALEDFKQIATTKQVEYGLLPKFIEKIDPTWKIDESVVDRQDAQGTIAYVKGMVNNFRTQLMTTYIQSLAHEYELIFDEIKRMVEGMPKDNDDGFDAEPGYAAFKQYHDRREKRFNLEIEKSLYFLEEKRVEGNSKDPKGTTTTTTEEEEIIAPTPVRQLPEDFWVPQ
ncbi:unnamed protein product, partial [Rotaria magnacalcarata]